MPYYIPVESRETYMRFRESMEDSESTGVDEFLNMLLDLLDEQDNI